MMHGTTDVKYHSAFADQLAPVNSLRITEELFVIKQINYI
jgi:hypothetical protein